MTTPKAAKSGEQKVSGLTVAELRGIIREVVMDCIGESYEDFHRDLEISPEFAARLQESIDARAAGEPTVPWGEVKEQLGL